MCFLLTSPAHGEGLSHLRHTVWVEEGYRRQMSNKGPTEHRRGARRATFGGIRFRPRTGLWGCQQQQEAGQVEGQAGRWTGRRGCRSRTPCLCPARLASLPQLEGDLCSSLLVIPGASSEATVLSPVSPSNYCGRWPRPLGPQLSAVLGRQSGCWGHVWLSLASNTG